MVMASTPSRGDIIWLTFDPSAGHEQAGHRPALVISPKSYNTTLGLCLVCPITSQVKGYPFEVGLPSGLKVNGVVLADQVKNVDWKVRGSEYICRLPPEIMEDVIAKITSLLE
jgi:mRNA interferase MazF